MPPAPSCSCIRVASRSHDPEGLDRRRLLWVVVEQRTQMPFGNRRYVLAVDRYRIPRQNRRAKPFARPLGQDTPVQAPSQAPPIQSSEYLTERVVRYTPFEPELLLELPAHLLAAVFHCALRPRSTEQRVDAECHRSQQRDLYPPRVAWVVYLLEFQIGDAPLEPLGCCGISLYSSSCHGLSRGGVVLAPAASGEAPLRRRQPVFAERGDESDPLRKPGPARPRRLGCAHRLTGGPPSSPLAVSGRARYSSACPKKSRPLSGERT